MLALARLPRSRYSHHQPPPVIISAAMTLLPMRHSNADSRLSHKFKLLQVTWAFSGLAAAIIVAPALAVSCRGNQTPDRLSPEFTCVSLSSQLLGRLRFADRLAVSKMMGTPGRPIYSGVARADRLQFVGKDKSEGAYSGLVNLSFKGDRVVTIQAGVVLSPIGTKASGQQVFYSWYQDKPGCSDFPSSRVRCTQ